MRQDHIIGITIRHVPLSSNVGGKKRKGQTIPIRDYRWKSCTRETTRPVGRSVGRLREMRRKDERERERRRGGEEERRELAPAFLSRCERSIREFHSCIVFTRVLCTDRIMQHTVPPPRVQRSISKLIARTFVCIWPLFTVEIVKSFEMLFYLRIGRIGKKSAAFQITRYQDRVKLKSRSNKFFPVC